MKANKVLIASVALALVALPVAFAQTPQEKGYAIAERSDKSDAGFGASTVRLTMTLADPRGRETVRELQIDTLEKEGEGNGVFTPNDKGEADLAWIAYIVAEK